MGLASLGLEIGIYCDFLYSVFILNAILGLDFLGLGLSRPQVRLQAVRLLRRLRPHRPRQPPVLSGPGKGV
jgi:hypothetical protein